MKKPFWKVNIFNSRKVCFNPRTGIIYLFLNTSYDQVEFSLKIEIFFMDMVTRFACNNLNQVGQC